MNEQYILSQIKSIELDIPGQIDLQVTLKSGLWLMEVHRHINNMVNNCDGLYTNSCELPPLFSTGGSNCHRQTHFDLHCHPFVSYCHHGSVGEQGLPHSLKEKGQQSPLRLQTLQVVSQRRPAG